MTQKEMIEVVQQHHPNIGETIIRKTLNRAMDDFSAKTEVLKDIYDATTVADTRNYLLNTEIIKINRIDLDKEQIPRLLVKPPNSDLDIP